MVQLLHQPPALPEAPLHARRLFTVDRFQALPLSAVVSPAHEQMVRAYLAALTGDAHAVDDLSQEVFLRALERLDEITARSDTPRYLRGVARRVALEHLRARRRSRRFIDATLDSLAADDECVAALTLHRESLHRLHALVEELPLISRRMLEMRYHDELSAQEIGARLGIDPGAVRVTLLRIRERLKRRLEASPPR